MKDPAKLATTLRRRVARKTKALREAAELTRAQLAERAGLSPSLIREIEEAEANLTITTLVKLANAFGITPADLFGQPPKR